MKQSGNKSKCRINKVGVTTDTLTGRGGMALFVRYIEKVMPMIEPLIAQILNDLKTAESPKKQ